MRYRFSFTQDGDPFPTEETFTVDAAIHRAVLLHKKESAVIYVRVFEGGQSRVVVRVDGSGWRWMKQCPKCKGDGHLTLKTKTVPVVTAVVNCTCCHGARIVEDIDHG